MQELSLYWYQGSDLITDPVLKKINVASQVYFDSLELKQYLHFLNKNQNLFTRHRQFKDQIMLDTQQ